MINKLVRNKKLLNSWYEYNIINEKETVIKKVVANKNFKLLSSDSWNNPKLYSVNVKYYLVDKEENGLEFDNYILINGKNEIILENIKSILIVGDNWNLNILEFDTRTFNTKKYKLKKNDRLYCLVNNEGVIVHGPTTTPIKYSPFINCIIIGNKNFEIHHSREVYDTLVEVITDNTYLVNKGNKQGLLFGQAFWNENEKFWRNYTCIHWLPIKYDKVEFFPTDIQDFYIVKLNDIYTFYYVKRYDTGLQNEFFGGKYKKIRKIFNALLFKNIGFLCIKEDDTIDYVYGFNNLQKMNTVNENEALQMINTMIQQKNIIYDDLVSNYPEFHSFS